MLVLTRSEVLDIRAVVTVAEISTTARRLAAELWLAHSGSEPEPAGTH
ncbi:MAG: hypothetical protein HKN91_07435, partial [Acidimicrobiia bacterium]|nr:hypothetical protein [Acidimicrobiia bacterium]